MTWRKALYWLAYLLVGLVAYIVLLAFVPPLVTPLMLIRLVEGYGIHKQWVPMTKISNNVTRAVIAAEDSRFCEHGGFDWESINKAVTDWQRGKNLRGASTISQQTAKNLFLWPHQDVIRKVLEIPLTLMIEAVWPKRRILEVYLNIAEWGPGVYGINAAARRYFHTTPAGLSLAQASYLAAVLPNPRHWSPVTPGPYVRHRAGIIQSRAYRFGPATGCLRVAKVKKK